MKSPAFSIFATVLSLVVTGSAFNSLHADDRKESSPGYSTGIFHLSEARGPIRHPDLSPLTKEISSEILVGPANGLESAFIIYTRMAAGAHKKGLFTLPADETYLVLSGKLNIQLGADEFTAGPDTLVLVPAGVPHQVWNSAAEPEADIEVVTPAPARDLLSMMKKAEPKKIANAAQYVRVPPPLKEMKGGVGHEGLNERVLASRETGSEHVLERLDDVLPAAGGPGSHLHPFDQVYFVTRGTMTVQYGMDKYEAGANSLVILPKGVVHSNVNNGSINESHITLLFPEPPKGFPMGSAVTMILQNGRQTTQPRQ